MNIKAALQVVTQLRSNSQANSLNAGVVELMVFAYIFVRTRKFVRTGSTYQQLRFDYDLPVGVLTQPDQ